MGIKPMFCGKNNDPSCQTTSLAFQIFLKSSLYLFSALHVCVYVCVACAHVCMPEYGVQKPTWVLLVPRVLILWFEERSYGVEFSKPKDLQVSTSPVLGLQVQASTPSFLIWVCGIRSQVLLLARQALYHVNYLLSHTVSYVWKLWVFVLLFFVFIFVMIALTRWVCSLLSYSNHYYF